MLTIQKITSQETYIVRHAVLRKGKPITSCHFEGDDLPTTFHLGLRDGNALVGVASVFEKRCPLFDELHQAQLRGMAILDSEQRKGYGQLLVLACEKEVQHDTTLLWFNAREKAVPFYKKMGYETVGNPFPIDGIGIHYVMYKILRT